MRLLLLDYLTPRLIPLGDRKHLFFRRIRVLLRINAAVFCGGMPVVWVAPGGRGHHPTRGTAFPALSHA